MILSKKGFIFLITFILLIFNQGCDESSSSIWVENLPRVYLELESINHIEEGVFNLVEIEELEEGDSISLKLALKVDHMDDLFDMAFSISFNENYFEYDATDFSFTINNFFAHSEEIFTDCNDDLSICEGDADWDPDTMGNGVWDLNFDENGDGLCQAEDECEPFTDSIDNDVWDGFIPSLGFDLLEEDDLTITAGATAPEENGTVWGSGVVCYIYFHGVAYPSDFNLTILGVNNFSSGLEPVSTLSWSIDSFFFSPPASSNDS